MSAQVTWNDKVIDRTLEAALDGLEDAGEFLLEEANRTVPIEEATLEGSGTVTMDRRNRQVLVSYDTPYAVRQHEDTRLRHDPGRRAKWLERTFDESGPDALDYIANKVKAAI